MSSQARALTFHSDGAAHGDLGRLALALALLAAQPLVHGDEAQPRQPLALALDVVAKVNFRRRRRHNRRWRLVARPAKRRANSQTFSLAMIAQGHETQAQSGLRKHQHV